VHFNLELERDGAVDLGEKANFIDLNAIMVETEVGETLKSRREDGGPQFDFLSAERKEGKNFELAGEMRVLVEDLPDLDEIAHSEGLSFKNKGVGVKNNKIEGPVAPQNAPNVEIVKVFIPGAYFMPIPVTHNIGAAEDEEID
jgi:hypothetical protein